MRGMEGNEVLGYWKPLSFEEADEDTGTMLKTAY